MPTSKNCPRVKATSGTNPLPQLIHAAAHDAGSRHMREHSRKQWNDDDWNAMVAEQDRLIAATYGEGVEGSAKFCFAGTLVSAGVLDIATQDFWGVFNKAWAVQQASFAEAA